ncbi:MAG TPA: hypothetical protein VGR40_03745 [Candidatus Binatus sp.]|nr:hypothetical protein [Candidatus Binatus sp.]
MFERFGAKFLDHHLDVTLVHRGLNVQMNPVGRTIDNYDDASRTGAEYSIEQDYFVGQMDKASGDLTHVLEKHPGVVDIYLLSSRKAPEGVIPAYTQRVALWPGMVGRKLHLYDARRIAETIVDDLLLSDAAIDDLVEHLPSLANIIDDAAAALVMPRPDERHLLRPRVDQMIGDELAANGPVVVLSGIGGLGKSDAAIAYAAAHGADYKMLLWIDGERLRRVEDLKAVELWRGGKTRNVEGLMKSRQCLVIIDDSSDAIDRTALARICGLGTHVIVTRRVLAANDLEIPLLDGEEARAILDRDLAEPCPPHVFAQLIETLGGHRSVWPSSIASWRTAQLGTISLTIVPAYPTWPAATSAWPIVFSAASGRPWSTSFSYSNGRHRAQ